MKTLYTVGYEGQSVQDFVEILQTYQIKRIIDVRRNPISRKFGFSKRKFESILAEANIDYVHIVELGTPKLVREELKQNKDYDLFFDMFEEYLVQQKEPLERAINLALETPSAILCFERNHTQCHRMAVAAYMSQLSDAKLTVEHICL